MTDCFDCAQEIHEKEWVYKLCKSCLDKRAGEAHWHSDTPAMLLFKTVIEANDNQFNLLLILLQTAERWECLPNFKEAHWHWPNKELGFAPALVSHLLYDIILKLADDLTYYESVVDDLYEVKIVDSKPQTMIGPAFDALLLDENSSREEADRCIEGWWHGLERDGWLPSDWYAEKYGQGRNV